MLRMSEYDFEYLKLTLQNIPYHLKYKKPRFIPIVLWLSLQHIWLSQRIIPVHKGYDRWVERMNRYIAKAFASEADRS